MQMRRRSSGRGSGGRADDLETMRTEREPGQRRRRPRPRRRRRRRPRRRPTNQPASGSRCSSSRGGGWSSRVIDENSFNQSNNSNQMPAAASLPQSTSGLLSIFGRRLACATLRLSVRGRSRLGAATGDGRRGSRQKAGFRPRAERQVARAAVAAAAAEAAGAALDSGEIARARREMETGVSERENERPEMNR